MATLQKQLRCKRVLEMLTSQLGSGVKTKKGTRDQKEPLTEADKKRLNKEIEILKERV